MPSVQLTERAGFEFMLVGLAQRVRQVEVGLDAISAEAKPDAQPTIQQMGLINFFVPNMKVEAALARMEATGKTLIDFEVLGRAVTRMGELTSDFLASVNGMRRTVSDTLRETARTFRPYVSRVNRGFMTILKFVTSSPIAAGDSTKALPTRTGSLGSAGTAEVLPSLTDKQRAVLDLLIEHKTSKEISRELGISPHTVDQRIMLARAKLGVVTRIEVAQAYRRLLADSAEAADNSAEAPPARIDSFDPAGNADVLSSLTDKQMAVLDLLIEYKSSKEISRILGISPHTVDRIILLACAKLGVATRAQVVQVYRRLRTASAKFESEYGRYVNDLFIGDKKD